MLCVLEKDEIGFAAEIYAQGFGMGENQARGVIENFAQTVYVSKENSIIKGIICASSVKLNDEDGLFIHGGVTVPQYRGNGTFKALFNYALNAKPYAFCAAANTNGHEEFYEALGFQKSFLMRSLNREIKRNLWARADFDTVTAKKLCENRKKYIKSAYVQINFQQAAALLSGLYSRGISSAETSKAYALYYRLPDKLLVTELYAETDVDAWFLLEAIADRDKRNTAQILLSSENRVFSGEGQRFNAGMVLNLKGTETGYLGEMPG